MYPTAPTARYMDNDIVLTPLCLTDIRVGILGLGKMGLGIATRLLHHVGALYVVTGDRPMGTPKRALIEAGAIAVASPALLARNCDIVLSCLPDSTSVRAACLGSDGLLEGSRPGFIHVDHTTGAPQITREIAAAYATGGATLIDAAMLRTPEAAMNGELVLLTGGPAALLAYLAPLFARYSIQRIHVGDVGAGQSLKLISSFIGLGMATVISQAFDIARGAGIGIDLLQRAISGTGADSRTFQALTSIAFDQQTAQRAPQSTASDLPDITVSTGAKATATAPATRQFSLAHAAKDMRYLSDLSGGASTADALAATLSRLHLAIAEHGAEAPVSNIGLQVHPNL